MALSFHTDPEARFIKSGAGTEQRGSRDHRDHDHKPEIALAVLRFGAKPALLGRVFSGLGNRGASSSSRMRNSPPSVSTFDAHRRG
jgi:hypothetical protein